MFSFIDPVYVVVLLLLAAGGGAWYWRNHQQRGHKKELGIETNPYGDQKPEQSLQDSLQEGEPEAPKLKPEDMVKPVAAEPSAAAPEAPQQSELPLTSAETPKPEEAAPAEVPEPVPDVEEVEKPQGHRLARIDEGIEAVLHFTPIDTPAFDLGKLLAAEKAVKSLEMPFPMQLSFFSAKTGLWMDEAAFAEDCREFYVSTLVANRRKKLDNLEVSRFLALADRLAIDLSADVVMPDAERILETADKVTRIVERFSQYLTFKLVGAQDIEDSAFNEAALGCGFVYSEGHYEKRDPGMSDPQIVLGRMPQLKNELGLGINVPLTNPASKPLSELCAVANDLACRLDLELTDPYGAPVSAASASAIARQLTERYQEMATAGVPAGSPRARRIFTGS